MTLFSMTILTLGLGLNFWRHYGPKPSGEKTVEQYWADAGMKGSELEELLSGSRCYASERYYLSCVNTILSVANRFNLTLNQAGKLQSVDTDRAAAESVANATEKSQLIPWRKLFSQNKKQALSIGFSKAWDELKEFHIKPAQLPMMSGVGLNGFISIFRDPHTYFMPVSQFHEVVAKADSKSLSLGVSLGTRQGKAVIRRVMTGSSAESNGVQRGDEIISVNGAPVKGFLLSRISELLKGEKDESVILELSRQGELLKVKLVRQAVQTATVSIQVLDGEKPVAVIGVTKFARGTCDKVKTALQVSEKTGVRGLVLDLRDNPGGQMEEAACVTSLFVGTSKKVFEIRYLDPNVKGEAYYGTEEKVSDLPLAILINAASASAAEIVAGALRDFNRAVLVGERSFGKGSFQEGEFWESNDKIALFETKGFYYLPSGVSPQMKGLSPDVELASDEISILRESDQFLYPLRAPERKLTMNPKRMTQQRCLTIESHKDVVNQQGADLDVRLTDQQVDAARQILLCSKPMARTAL